MILPIVGGLTAIGGALLCSMGVTTEEGTGPGGSWRIRWACWRWIAEKKVHAEGSKWYRIGVFRMGKVEGGVGGRGLAKAAAILSVSLAPRGPGAEPLMVRILKGIPSEED